MRRLPNYLCRTSGAKRCFYLAKLSRENLRLSDEEKIERLLEIPLFAVLSVEARATLAKALKTRRMIKGQPVFLQGDPGDDMYLVLKGRVRICCESLSGREITLCNLKDGGFFGEMALLDGDCLLYTSDAADE